MERDNSDSVSDEEQKSRGFTLTELIIVIIIVGILATLALPQFTISRERALGREAIANLKLIAAAEKIYDMEWTDYYPIPAGSESVIGNINDYLKLYLNETNWDYSVTSGIGAFTSTAKRWSGPYSNCTYTIDNTTDEPTPSNCP